MLLIKGMRRYTVAKEKERMMWDNNFL